MDTDDLTPMAYEVLTLAYHACEPMRAEIGATAMEYVTEDEFLAGVATFLEEITEDAEAYLESWELLDEIELESFTKEVKCIQMHITSTLCTPRAKRGKPPFEK